MTNLSSLSKLRLVIGAEAALALALIGLSLLGLPLPVTLALSAGQVLLAALGLLFASQIGSFLAQIVRVGEAIQAGNFDKRLNLRRERGDLRRAGDRINGVIDINDAFVREAALAMTAASEGRFYRKIRPEGMRGAFRHSVNKINAAIDILADRPRLLRQLRQAFGDVVDAAVAGDFSRRVSTDFSDVEIKALAGSVNNLIDTVDRGLSEAGVVLAALGRMELNRRIEGHYEGAFMALKSNTNKVADTLADVVSRLKTTSGAVHTATGEILAGANDLSERTLRQAATIEQTSASVEEVSSVVSANAARALQASKSAADVNRIAGEGGLAMEQANGAMGRITQSSAKISNIIGMIDDIAFQTNLLALNASVEAARAGEAGKGFAVVAVEVRRLAQSAAEASKDIKDLIEVSSEEVREGSRLVADAAGKLEAMIEVARSNDEIMNQIARLSAEQATALGSISSAVHQLDEMTQHNAALVEETNAAIEQTEAQVSELNEIVAMFRVGSGGGAGRQDYLTLRRTA